MADPRSRGARRPGGRQRGSRSTADVPRLAAYEVLRAVASEDAYANLQLPASPWARSRAGSCRLA